MSEYSEQEIDLRPYVEALANNWKWILGAGIVAAVLALAASFLIAPTYEASALVAITNPRQVVQFEPRIKAEYEDEPYEAYPELATSDELLLSLLSEVTPIAPDVTTLVGLKEILSADPGSDPSLLRLAVSYGEPETAAEIANGWAALFVVKANEVFGLQGDEQLGFFGDQLKVTSVDLEQAERALIDFQGVNRSLILENELLALQETQADQLAKQKEIAFLLQDAKGLQEQLSDTNTAGSDLSSADQLAAILLQLRAYSGVANDKIARPWQLQVNVDQLGEAGRGEQIDFLSGLQETLMAQAEQIDSDLSELEPLILAVQRDKQEADARTSLLERNLEVAEETYTALALKVEEEQITSQNTLSGVKMASKSAVPEEPSGPRKFLIAGIALILGLIIGVAVIILITWWRS